MQAIIIPTLNEAANIEKLVRMIYDTLSSNDTQVLIVDDDSTDDTHTIVENLQREFTNLALVVRRGERGLGSAVRAGAKLLGDNPVVVMDADLSHNPIYLPSIFEKLGEGYDLVAGSRYIPNGDTVGWPGSRIAVSKVATLMARTIFYLPVKDPMTGFVGCRSASLLSQGFEHADFKFFLEMMVADRSLRVTEVPIVFQDRERGKSKLDGMTIALYIALLLRLMFGRKKSKSTS